MNPRTRTTTPPEKPAVVPASAPRGLWRQPVAQLTRSVTVAALLMAATGCEPEPRSVLGDSDQTVDRLQPVLVTEKVPHDTDDPAIWINPDDPSKSLVLGTDKGGDDGDGGLYVFNLDGTIDRDRSVTGLARPNNVDVAYGLALGGGRVDYAVVTERLTNKIRLYALPDMTPIDGGGIPVFEGEDQRAPMGVAVYADPADGEHYVVVGRKDGPTDGSYLWQYRLFDAGNGTVGAEVVRRFGAFSGEKEIEAIAVDSELGYIYYSDEQVGVRKYFAHPDSSSRELLLFAVGEVRDDHEGISVYRNADGTGVIVLSDQQARRFNVYRRTGDNAFLGAKDLAVRESDGNDITSTPLGPDFPQGLFVAMSDDRTFHFYRADDLIGAF